MQESRPTLDWSPLQAKEIIGVWQRKFADSIYNHELNFKTDEDGDREEHRIIHPLASTSISDMLVGIQPHPITQTTPFHCNSHI